MRLEFIDSLQIITRLGPDAPHQKKITNDLALIANRIVAREQEKTGESFEEVMARAWKGVVTEQAPPIPDSSQVDPSVQSLADAPWEPGKTQRAADYEVGADPGAPEGDRTVETFKLDPTDETVVRLDPEAAHTETPPAHKEPAPTHKEAAKPGRKQK